VLSAVCQKSRAAEQKMTLKHALGSKSVGLEAVGKGGAMGECLILNLKNNTDKPLIIVVDPGLIFVPADTAYQNLVLLGMESIEIAPGIAKELTVSTFCGKSYAKCPPRYHRYTYWRQGDTNMVKVLNYVRENGIAKEDIGLAQRAVWTFTNKYHLRSVYDPAKPQLSEQLIRYMADVRKVKIPDYFSYTDLAVQRAGAPLFTGQHQRVSVLMKWGNIDYRMMFVRVKNENGDIYRKLESGQYIDKNGHTMVVEFNADRDPAGTYTVEVCDENQKVWDRKVVVVGDNPLDN